MYIYVHIHINVNVYICIYIHFTKNLQSPGTIFLVRLGINQQNLGQKSSRYRSIDLILFNYCKTFCCLMKHAQINVKNKEKKT